MAINMTAFGIMVIYKKHLAFRRNRKSSLLTIFTNTNAIKNLDENEYFSNMNTFMNSVSHIQASHIIYSFFFINFFMLSIISLVSVTALGIISKEISSMKWPKHFKLTFATLILSKIPTNSGRYPGPSIGP